MIHCFWCHAIKFDRWQHSAVGRGARFAVAGATCYLPYERYRFWRRVCEQRASVTACRGRVLFAPAGNHFRSCAVWLRRSSDVMPALSRCDWPGDVRRLTAWDVSCLPEITWPPSTMTSAPTTSSTTRYRPTTACRIRLSAQWELGTGMRRKNYMSTHNSFSLFTSMQVR